nr:hypothetical protein [Tanacetum cinerariifolium]
MHCVGKTVIELHALLINYGKGLKDKAPTPQVLTIQKGRENKLKPQANKKDKSKGKTDKNKKVVPYQPKPKHNPLKRKENPNKDQICVVSLSCLLDLGFNHTIASNGISVSLNGLFYFSSVSVNDVFEIDMNNNVSKNNNNSIFSINKKRKLDLDSSYLWHCRLVHIGKTRMQKLQREGLLESINDESFDKYESCIFGKMTKKPFNNNIERATDLLGLIHTDVCSHLDMCQGKQNGVSERRNRTLLYMVRSMSNLMTLPLSFCDYALESAICILNMVPTKKVNKTPYEIWHGKAPNLPYLKVWGCEAYVKRNSADKLY